MSERKSTLEVLFERLHKGQLSFVLRIVRDARSEFAACHALLDREERRKVRINVVLIANMFVHVIFESFSDSHTKVNSAFQSNSLIEITSLS